MGQQLIGYDVTDLPYAMDVMENATAPGGYCQVQLYTGLVPSPEARQQVFDAITATGHTISFPVTQVVNGVPVTSFNIRRDMPYEQYQWQFLIPLVVPLLVGGLVVFGITQINNISSALVPLLLIVGGIAITAIALLRKPAQAYIERGGKIPYLPSTILLEPATKKRTPELSDYEFVLINFASGYYFSKDYSREKQATAKKILELARQNKVKNIQLWNADDKAWAKFGYKASKQTVTLEKAEELLGLAKQEEVKQGRDPERPAITLVEYIPFKRLHRVRDLYFPSTIALENYLDTQQGPEPEVKKDLEIDFLAAPTIHDIDIGPGEIKFSVPTAGIWLLLAYDDKADKKTRILKSWLLSEIQDVNNNLDKGINYDVLKAATKKYTQLEKVNFKESLSNDKMAVLVEDNRNTRRCRFMQDGVMKEVFCYYIVQPARSKSTTLYASRIHPTEFIPATVEDDLDQIFKKKENAQIVVGLLESERSEVEAIDNYTEREQQARILGDEKTADIYKELTQDEKEHLKEIGSRMVELQFNSDSPEFLADTIISTGWRDKLDTVFQAAVDRVKGG